LAHRHGKVRDKLKLAGDFAIHSLRPEGTEPEAEKDAA
jgi:hypothetical protein